MKNWILIFALIFCTTAVAQEYKPIKEKQGDLVKATFFHDNGEIAQVGFYKNDKPHGEWIAFNQEGVKISKGTYDMGVKVGTWYFWTEAGLNEVDYKNGRIIKVTKWDSSKTIVVN